VDVVGVQHFWAIRWCFEGILSVKWYPRSIRFPDNDHFLKEKLIVIWSSKSMCFPLEFFVSIGFVSKLDFQCFFNKKIASLLSIFWFEIK
jgi:hypothetical protein